jgi:hypothetical protein
MANNVILGAQIVAVTPPDGPLEHWAAAVPREQAVALVKELVHPKARVELTTRLLTPRNAEGLTRLKPNGAIRLQF